MLGEKTINLALFDAIFFLQIVLSKDRFFQSTGWNIYEFGESRGVFSLTVPFPVALAE